MRHLLISILAFIFIPFLSGAQFTYSGYIYNANGVGAVNVPVKLYRRVTSNIAGFTSQTNYNGHSYYRSTSTAYWLDAKTACENMNGHLVTMSNASENSFVYSTWSSGWIGYYQDKTGAFYSEPNAGWRWTENYVTAGQQANYDVASYSSGSSLADIKSSVNATLYNSPAYTSTGGKYLTFNGSSTYGITGDLSSKMGNTNVITLLAWVYPTGNGVIVSELGTGSTSSGWHESVFEITGSNTLRVGLWSGSGIVQLNTSITLNTWHLIGLTYNGTTMTGYKDGVSFGTTNFTRAAAHLNGNGEYFAMGLTDGTNMGSGAYGAFRLGGFQVYNTSLTSDEMNRNYMSSAWRFGIYPYSNWSGGEPNNSGGEDYTQFAGSGTWNDLPNGYALNYVIEFDYIVTTTSWVLYNTVYTDATGKYTINETTNPSIEWYIQIDAPTTTTALQTTDASAVSTKAILRTYTSLDYYKYDVNNDGNINVSDEYYVFMKKSGRFTTWNASLPNVRLFTAAQFSTISSSSSDLRTTYPGVQSITINTPTSGGSSNYYLINTGYSNSTILGY